MIQSIIVYEQLQFIHNIHDGLYATLACFRDTH